MTDDLNPNPDQPDHLLLPAGDSTLEAVRALVLKAHPDIVPELVAGETIEDLIASISPATDAYARLTEGLRPSAPSVPAGASTSAPLDADRLSPTVKIQVGLRNRTAR